MRVGAIFQEDAGRCLLPKVWRAASAWEKMRGLLGRPQLAEGEGLLIDSCAMVHTFGMRYSLDLAFLDPQGRVCKLVTGLPPARCAGSLGAETTLELAPGALEQLHLKVGDRLAWREAA